jgi:hypothetical protein
MTGAIFARKSTSIAFIIAATLFSPGPLAAQDKLELAASPLHERAPRWRCPIVQQYHCTAGGCRAVPPSVTIVLDFPARRYKRCDAKGCGQHPLSVATGGIYTTVTPGPGAFLKVVNDGSDFVEVASSGTETVTGFGKCERAQSR